MNNLWFKSPQREGFQRVTYTSMSGDNGRKVCRKLQDADREAFKQSKPQCSVVKDTNSCSQRKPLGTITNINPSDFATSHSQLDLGPSSPVESEIFQHDAENPTVPSPTQEPTPLARVAQSQPAPVSQVPAFQRPVDPNEMTLFMSTTRHPLPSSSIPEVLASWEIRVLKALAAHFRYGMNSLTRLRLALQFRSNRALHRLQVLEDDASWHRGESVTRWQPMETGLLEELAPKLAKKMLTPGRGFGIKYYRKLTKMLNKAVRLQLVVEGSHRSGVYRKCSPGARTVQGVAAKCRDSSIITRTTERYKRTPKEETSDSGSEAE